MEAVLAELEKDTRVRRRQTVRQGHLALLKRWYYRPEVKREGRDLSSRMRRAIGRSGRSMRERGASGGEEAGSARSRSERMAANRMADHRNHSRDARSRATRLDPGQRVGSCRADRGANPRKLAQLVECLWDEDPGDCQPGCRCAWNALPATGLTGAAVEGCAARPAGGNDGEQGALEPGAD